MVALVLTRAAGSGDRSSRLDPAPRVADFLIRISGSGFGCADQKRLHAFVDHKAAFSVTSC